MFWRSILEKKTRKWAPRFLRWCILDGMHGFLFRIVFEVSPVSERVALKSTYLVWKSLFCIDIFRGGTVVGCYGGQMFA